MCEMWVMSKSSACLLKTPLRHRLS
uniref:Uncharacterized protein n=1 Tax=Anguilla anguilla TaxID=7936 RepID=A0A0E9XJR5_ANGAN